MSRQYRERAPHTQRMVLDGRDSEFFVCEGVRPVNVSAFFATAMGSDGLRPEQVLERMTQGFEAAPRSVWEPAARLLDQERDGVAAEVLYSSMGMLLFGLEDTGWTMRTRASGPARAFLSRGFRASMCASSCGRRSPSRTCGARRWPTSRPSA